MIVVKEKILYLSQILKTFVDTQKVSMIKKLSKPNDIGISNNSRQDEDASMIVVDETLYNYRHESLNKKGNNKDKKLFNLYEIKI